MPKVPNDPSAYLTFLPPMSDGFHIGYHTHPGLVCDHSQRPGQWLESLARYMQTPGQDVGFAIPDVLAGEQQLRRLTRLSPQEAAAHQQMTDYDALLALLLLWDLEPNEPGRPLLELRQLSGQATEFSRAVTGALSPRRAPEGLWVFTLRAPAAPQSEARPIALLSHQMILVPAADPGDLSLLLPAWVRWYDRAAARWLSPCEFLNLWDAQCLISRLELLKQLNEQQALQSPLYHPDAALCVVLDRLIAAIEAPRLRWQQQVKQGTDAALSQQRTLLLAVHTLQNRLEMQEQTLDFSRLGWDTNPLLQNLMGAVPPKQSSAPRTFYAYQGQWLAMQSDVCLVEPARTADETKLLAQLSRELELLQAHDPAWRKAAAEKLNQLGQTLTQLPGAGEKQAKPLFQWAHQLEQTPVLSACQATLRYPLEHSPASLGALMQDALGFSDPEALSSPFSDCLVLTEGCAFPQAAPVAGMTDSVFALPPLSPQLCACLASCAELDDLYAPAVQNFACVWDEAAKTVTASFTLSRRLPGQGAAAASAITFVRTYALCDQPQSGGAVLMRDLPQVTVWPNIRLAAGLWKSYYVFTANPNQVDAWALDHQGWVQGRLYSRQGLTWQTACVPRFPIYISLRRGALSMGALINDTPRRVLKREDACAIAIDFGSISTTVMLRQGQRVQPAILPEGLHRHLLLPADPAPMEEVFLPAWAMRQSSTYYSVMDLFTDQPDRWAGVLRDGHIYYPSDLNALLAKGADSLYYDLKWGQEDYARQCLRLFLKQVMLQAMLAARLDGSASAAFRISMPNAMPLHKQEAYLEMARGLARELSAETGLPLPAGTPSVLYASENQADGLYFRDCGEVNAQTGYLNLDIGGGTADISLWLNHAAHASLECSLPLGCRQLLFDSLMEWRRQELEQDFDIAALHDATLQVVCAFENEGENLRGRHKCMLLLDDLFASYAQEIRACMAQARSAGRISYVESLLLFEMGFLFTLVGELLERANREKSLAPLLPEQMELCIAGNGGQLLKIFSDEQRTKLCALALSRLSETHPLRMLLPVQSRDPKQEVARGLLAQDDCLQSAIQGNDRWNGTFEGEAPGDLLAEYLPTFYRLFPQAAQRLMPRAFDDSREAALTSTSLMELAAIRSNQLSRFPRDDMALYAACFTALKRLWRI